MNMVLQLHITGNCNLRCKHCYIGSHTTDMSFRDVKRVIRQFCDLIKSLEEQKGERVQGHIHFTGGEPLMHCQAEKILRLMVRYRRRFRFGIMSNGSFLNEKNIRLLKKLRLKSFQLSLDGNREIHDFIRGEGNYDTVLKAMDTLNRANIPVRVSFTASENNYKSFPEVARVCREHGVSTLWTDRYIPFSECSYPRAMDRSTFKDYAVMLNQERLKYEDTATQVQSYRALQFLESGLEAYRCTAGESLITVDEHGDIMPCRRLPLVCGNIKETTLKQIYFENETFISLRKHECSGKCLSCEHLHKCAGGERCFTYAVKGDYRLPDPCCYVSENA